MWVKLAITKGGGIFCFELFLILQCGCLNCPKRHECNYCSRGASSKSAGSLFTQAKYACRDITQEVMGKGKR